MVEHTDGTKEDILVFTDEPYLYCGVKALFVMDDKDCIAFMPVSEGYSEEIFFCVNKTEDGDVVFEDIDDDEEYDIVANAYELVDDEVNKI